MTRLGCARRCGLGAERAHSKSCCSRCPRRDRIRTSAVRERAAPSCDSRPSAARARRRRRSRGARTSPCAARAREQVRLPGPVALPGLATLRRRAAGVAVPVDAILVPAPGDDVGQPSHVVDVIAVLVEVVLRRVVGAKGTWHEVRSREPVGAGHDVGMAVAVEVAHGRALVRADQERLLREAQAPRRGRRGRGRGSVRRPGDRARVLPPGPGDAYLGALSADGLRRSPRARRFRGRRRRGPLPARAAPPATAPPLTSSSGRTGRRLLRRAC
jgi:hypothetical protein